ncbi:60S ribosomal protein L18a-like protein [Rhodamnia argentea]|uniref:60S ribosomal protein L18a-like protein n=1 Tax=Rhodamnia argentea TaxID=178133 RepID=A0ABM3H1G2_9MYRT|nr:60S ribosomal protein L18a-like protein [Rhodamnia argentea]XP_048130438.1 60S ribosomal protein L18a-like protein [Rhodamnia argentea]
MSKGEEQNRGISTAGSGGSGDPQPQYGTFQGVANYPPPHPPPHQPAIGFPQPVPPPGASHDPSAPPPYQAQGYQAVPGYPVAEGRPVRERRLPCCGLGFGWCLFIIGFFLATIPWYVGLCFLVCCRHRMDYREKPGYIACTIAAVLATIAIIFGVTKGVAD